jgi:hypothetical protein
MHLRHIDKQEQRKPQISRWREITKIRDKSNEIEAKKTILSKCPIIHLEKYKKSISRKK